MIDPLQVSESDSGTVHTLLGELETCVEALLALPDIPVEPCREVQEKIVAQTFNLVVAGEFKRGKTTLINALIGADLLPVGVVPLTSVVTILSYGEQPSVQVVLQNDEQRLIGTDELWDYVTEKGNPIMSKASGKCASPTHRPGCKAASDWWTPLGLVPSTAITPM